MVDILNDLGNNINFPGGIGGNVFAFMSLGEDSPRHCFARRPSLRCAERGQSAI